MPLIPKQLLLLQKIVGLINITMRRLCGTVQVEPKRPIGRLGVDRKIIFKLILMKQDWRAWTKFICLGTGTSEGLF